MESKQNSPFVTPYNAINIRQQQTSTALQNWKVAVKDLFHIADIATGAGNPDWLASHAVPEQTASSVAKLVAAGASVIGKTVTDELAYSLNGNNIHFPALHNSLSQQRLCGGSSSGSALAVALGYARVGLGTDTGGSIRVPASYNNLVGFRPTHGAITMDNMVPLAPDFDTIGWLTKNVKDAYLVGHCLLPEQQPTLQSLDRVGLVDCAFELCEFQQQGRNWIERNLNSAAVPCSGVDESFLAKASNAFRVLQGAQIWQNHGQWIRQQKPTFAPDIQARFNWCQTLTKKQIEAANNVRKTVIKTLDSCFSRYAFLMLPTTPGAAPLINEQPESLAIYRNKLMQFTCLAGLSGRPQLHLPLFQEQDKAYGLSIIGTHNNDLALLKYGQRLMEKQR